MGLKKYFKRLGKKVKKSLPVLGKIAAGIVGGGAVAGSGLSNIAGSFGGMLTAAQETADDITSTMGYAGGAFSGIAARLGQEAPQVTVPQQQVRDDFASENPMVFGSPFGAVGPVGVGGSRAAARPEGMPTWMLVAGAVAVVAVVLYSKRR